MEFNSGFKWLNIMRLDVTEYLCWI